MIVQQFIVAHAQTNHALNRRSKKWDIMVFGQSRDIPFKWAWNETSSSFLKHSTVIYNLKNRSSTKNKNSEKAALESLTAILPVNMNFQEKIMKDISCAKSSAIKWHKAEFFWVFKGTWTTDKGIKHKQQRYENGEIVPPVIWVVFHSSYYHICGIFGNIIAEVWSKS